MLLLRLCCFAIMCINTKIGFNTCTHIVQCARITNLLFAKRRLYYISHAWAYTITLMEHFIPLNIVLYARWNSTHRIKNDFPKNARGMAWCYERSTYDSFNSRIYSITLRLPLLQLFVPNCLEWIEIALSKFSV